MECRHSEDGERALVIQGEDSSIQCLLTDDKGNAYPLTGCTGVSGQFANADGQTWNTFAGYVVSSDTGLVQIDILGSETSTMLIGARQQFQLLLTFGNIVRKVIFNDALDVEADLTSNPPSTPSGTSSWD